jgi:hypothetical protein
MSQFLIGGSKTPPEPKAKEVGNDAYLPACIVWAIMHMSGGASFVGTSKTIGRCY